MPHELIARNIPVSAEVTQSLAEHSCKLFKCDIVVAVIGLTTPGGSETKAETCRKYVAAYPLP